jgi:hypothetical protein
MPVKYVQKMAKPKKAEPIPEHTRAPDHTRENPATALMYETLVDLASRPEVRTVIEIGSTDGRGSTRALREGLEKNPNHPEVRLFCIEAVRQMFDVLAKGRAPYMKCYRVCSSHPDRHYTDKEIEAFFAYDWPQMPFETPAQRQDPEWHKRERDRYNLYFRKERLPLDGIALVKSRNLVDDFDLALCDGGTYSGRADVRAVYGAKYLVLDDIYTLKATWTFRELKKDPRYELIMHKDFGGSHFGYAAFRRTD